MRFFIKSNFKRINLLWCIPFGYRDENVFLTPFSKIVLNLKEASMLEIVEGDSCVLAETNIRKTRKILFTGFVGDVMTSDGFQIRMADISTGRKLFTISRKGEDSWSFEVNATNLKNPVMRSDMTFQLNVNDHNNPTIESHAEIVCSEDLLLLSKVLGVLVYSYVFDFLLDRGCS